jgi:two-component sensor histidine kinase
MADASAEVLPRFVELAMEMTGAVSAGLSLYDPDGAPDIFRWSHLRGTLARFEGATTPRNNSPCGVTLDQNGPVLVAHPEDIYDWVAAENLVLPEVLLVPLSIGRDEPLGTLWVVADRKEHFDSGDASALSDLAEFVGTALLMLRREEQSRRALEEQETVAMEMSHRLKNLFAVTDGMIRGTARNAATPAALADALSGRLHALASAQALILRNVSEIGSGTRTTELRSLIQAVLLAHGKADGREGSPFIVEGPQISCGHHAGNGIALVIHELATNAVKYGALSVEAGRIEIGWHSAGDKFHLQWKEMGGPLVETAPTASGFGSTLIQRTVKGQFRGVLKHDWRSDGLTVTITLSLPRMLV